MFVEAQDGEILTIDDGQFINLDEEVAAKTFKWNEQDWKHQSFDYHGNGYIYEVYDDQ